MADDGEPNSNERQIVITFNTQTQQVTVSGPQEGIFFLGMLEMAKHVFYERLREAQAQRLENRFSLPFPVRRS